MSFQRELLPPPRTFYSQELQQLGKERRGWASALCPFHADKHPSLAVNLCSGGFYCFSCGAKGGDIVAFVMLRDGVDFKAAVRRLGAWGEDGLSDNKDTRDRCKRRKLDKTAKDLGEKESQLRLWYCRRIHQARCYCRRAQERLRKIGPASSSQEAQNWWHVLALANEQERWAAAGYYILSFAAAHDRMVFMLFPDKRGEMIARALDIGYFRDRAGRIVEVDL